MPGVLGRKVVSAESVLLGENAPQGRVDRHWLRNDRSGDGGDSGYERLCGELGGDAGELRSRRLSDNPQRHHGEGSSLGTQVLLGHRLIDIKEKEGEEELKRKCACCAYPMASGSACRLIG